MKKILCTLAAILMVATGAKADEGMWLLPLLQKMNIKSMQEIGCELSAEEIYSINHSSLKDAIVHFGSGCTGEIISNEGLLVTNHHCGYGNIQKLSSDEHNYLENGYWAMSRNEELPCKGLTVTFLQNMTDVTPILNKEKKHLEKKYRNAENAGEKIAAELEAKASELIEAAKADYPHCEANIVSFYNNNVQYLIVDKVFTDVRFVGAPPASVGKFGGETDNWMWPRHTGDFSMFRVYAGKDNEPADYSEENVPYIPKKSLTISLKGVQENDFSFIMGYPGRTQRFQTASQLKQMIDINRIRVDARTTRQNIMNEGMEASPSVRLKYASKYARSSNGWKKWQGEELAFQKLNIIGREEQKEQDFIKWVGQKKSRLAQYGQALKKVDEAVAAGKDAERIITYINESVASMGPETVLINFFNTLNTHLKGSTDTAAVIRQSVEETLPLFKDYDVALEKKMCVAMLQFYRDEVDSIYFPQIKENFATLDFQQYVDGIFRNSHFATREKFEQVANLSIKDLADDPLKEFHSAIVQVITPCYASYFGNAEQLKEGSREFAAGLLKWQKGEPSYPDANSTMRLTYGTVKPYSPKDAVLYRHYSTLTGVMEKEDPNNYEFKVPAKLKELYEAKDFGMYAENDNIVTCFLTTNDITGGNSGSPVLNAKGELIGLAFDGNWESMSSDVMFEPDLQRCICVDIRYVLFMMDKFGGASHLLEEMNFSK